MYATHPCRVFRHIHFDNALSGLITRERGDFHFGEWK